MRENDKSNEGQLGIVLDSLVSGLGEEKRPIFMRDLILQLEESEHVRDAVKALVEWDQHSRLDEFRMWCDTLDQAIKLLNENSKLDWVNGMCLFSEFHAEQIDNYMIIAIAFRPDTHAEKTREILECCLDESLGLQQEFDALMTSHPVDGIERRKMIWDFEWRMSHNCECDDARSHPTFNWNP